MAQGDCKVDFKIRFFPIPPSLREGGEEKDSSQIRRNAPNLRHYSLFALPQILGEGQGGGKLKANFWLLQNVKLLCNRREVWRTAVAKWILRLAQNRRIRGNDR